MTNTPSNKSSLEHLWQKDGVWYLSPFLRSFLVRAKARYPHPTSSEGAPWPRDKVGVAQNLTYLFPGHVLKLNKILCPILGDDESLRHLMQTGEFTVVDLACGPGMASIATIDFLLQAMKSGAPERSAPLNLSFLLNDLQSACLEAAVDSLALIGNLLACERQPLRIASVNSFKG